ncbi:MAG: FAD-binding oxidoreductase [Pseudomonadota bacterium]
MRRWNGWGDETVTYPLPENAKQFLIEKIGETRPFTDVIFGDVLKKAPHSRLSSHPLVSTNPEARVRHARGQSLPDWLAMRSGHIDTFPDGVAHPISKEEVKTLLNYARKAEAVVIPYGGGTSVVGHITPNGGEKPVLTMNMGKMGRLLSLDRESRIATFGAGVAGPDLESQLRAHGYTLGHFPQSFELSTLGGWIATRSTGQQSLRYGRIEQLFAGGELETPSGTLKLPAFPASSAGPDLREIVLGSEGRLGILTEAKVRITRLPEKESFHAAFFPDWQSAKEAVRKAVQERIALSMLRLSNAAETETQLVLAGHERLVGFLKRFLSWQKAGTGRCMLIFGITGTKPRCRVAIKEALHLFKQMGGVHTGEYIGRKWAENRFRVAYLRNSLWEKGYAVDTIDTATDWQNVDHMVKVMESALKGALSPETEQVHCFSHLSHLYPQGASIYTTCLFRTADTHEETYSRWQRLKTAVSEAIVANQGTISHQHGVGTDHAPYLVAEKGELGMETIKNVCHQLDPYGIMNPGKLVK